MNAILVCTFSQRLTNVFVLRTFSCNINLQKFRSSPAKVSLQILIIWKIHQILLVYLNFLGHLLAISCLSSKMLYICKESVSVVKPVFTFTGGNTQAKEIFKLLTHWFWTVLSVYFRCFLIKLSLFSIMKSHSIGSALGKSLKSPFFGNQALAVSLPLLNVKMEC